MYFLDEPKFLLHLTLRLSQLYKLLSYFEGQSSGSRSHKRISKMNKRRLDAMMNLNKSVYNEQEVLEYLEVKPLLWSTNILLCRWDGYKLKFRIIYKDPDFLILWKLSCFIWVTNSIIHLDEN